MTISSDFCLNFEHFHQATELVKKQNMIFLSISQTQMPPNQHHSANQVLFCDTAFPAAFPALLPELPEYLKLFAANK